MAFEVHSMEILERFAATLEPNTNIKKRAAKRKLEKPKNGFKIKIWYGGF